MSRSGALSLGAKMSPNMFRDLQGELFVEDASSWERGESEEP